MGPGRKGFKDRNGNYWEPVHDGHRGTHAPHWDVQHPNGTLTPVYPNGYEVSLRVGNLVKLVTFDETLAAPNDAWPHDNYWRLIGEHGQIVSTEEPIHLKKLPGSPRVLVEFQTNISDLSLACHNEIANALWLRKVDLTVDEV